MWGWNESGQLGLAVNHSDTNDTSSSSTQIQCQAFPVPVDIPDDVDVMTVSCGSRHTAAITGEMLCEVAPLPPLPYPSSIYHSVFTFPLNSEVARPVKEKTQDARTVLEKIFDST